VELLRNVLLGGCLILIGLTGCVASTQQVVTTPAVLANTKGEIWTRTELFFGLARPKGPDITDDEWQRFVDTEVTPRFPDGLTVIPTTGQWGTPAGVVRERSRVLVLLHKPTKDSEVAIETIRQQYKKQFGQDSVLRTDSYQRVSF
jgi:hypothetical protein